LEKERGGTVGGGGRLGGNFGAWRDDMGGKARKVETTRSGEKKGFCGKRGI